MASERSTSTVSLPPYSAQDILAIREIEFGLGERSSSRATEVLPRHIVTPQLQAGEEPLPSVISAGLPMQNPNSLAAQSSVGEGRRVQTPHDAVDALEEAALRAAVASYKRQESVAESAPRSRTAASQPATPLGTLEAIVKRQGDDRMSLLKQHESEVSQVKNALERQIQLQAVETERVRKQQEETINAMATTYANNVKVVAQQSLPLEAKQTELKRLEEAHTQRVAFVKSQHAEQLSTMQLQAMSFMRMQEEELSRVRDVHQHTVVRQKEEHERELEAHVRAQQLTAALTPADAKAPTAAPPPPLPVPVPSSLPFPTQPPLPPRDAAKRAATETPVDPARYVTSYHVPHLDALSPVDAQPYASTGISTPAMAPVDIAALPRPTETVTASGVRMPALPRIGSVDTQPAGGAGGMAPEVAAIPAPLPSAVGSLPAPRAAVVPDSARDLYSGGGYTTSPPGTGRSELARAVSDVMMDPSSGMPIPAAVAPTGGTYTSTTHSPVLAPREPSVAAELLQRELEGMRGQVEQKEGEMNAAMQKFETEISGKRLEINHVRAELQRKEMTDEKIAVIRLEDLLKRKERELDNLVEDYRLAKLELSRGMLELKSNLRCETKKADEIRQQLTDVSNTLVATNERQQVLQFELKAERAKSAEAIRTAEALKPEVAHWKHSTEAATRATNLLIESQTKWAADMTEVETKRREQSVGILKSENDELKAMVGYLNEQLSASQKSIELAEQNSKHWRDLVDDLATRMRDAQQELSFSNQAIATLSNRNLELENLHMNQVVKALDHKYFGDDQLPLPQAPIPSFDASHAIAHHSPLAKQPSITTELRSVRDVAHSLNTETYAPVIDTLAKYLSSTKTDRRM